MYTKTEVSVRELKNHLAKYFRKAQNGERILVTNRGRPVASISMPQPSAETFEEKLARLESQGLSHPADQAIKLPKRLIPLEGEGPCVSEMMLADRGETIP